MNTTFTLGGKEYPFAYNLNMQIELKKEFGGIKNWVESISSKDDNGEPNIEAFLATMRAGINEGIRIKTGEKGTMTDMDVGAILSSHGELLNIQKKLLESIM